MNDVQETFKRVVNNALMDGLVQIVLNPFFLKMLQANEFHALIDNVAKESHERELQSLLKNQNKPELTGEAQAAALREQFGVDGLKVIGDVMSCSVEPIIPELPMSMQIPKFDRYNFPLRQMSNGFWEIGLNNPRVREAANMLTREFFREQGAVSSYEPTDQVLYYVRDFEPTTLVHIRNVTQNKDFSLSSPLEAFNNWFKLTSTKVAELDDAV